MNHKKGQYVVFIGDVALDEYYRAPRWPTIKDKTMVEALPAVPGGMIANAACVSAALGADVLFCTALNRGPVSQILLDDLSARGIDTALTVFDDTLPDSKTMIFLVEDEHTIFIPEMHISAIELSPGQLNTLAGARFIYSTPSTLSLLRCGGMAWPEIAAHCRQAGARIVCDYDVDYERNGDDGRFQAVDIGFFNEVGFDSVRQDRSYEEQAAHLHSLGMNTVVVTLAERGCVVYTQTGCFHAKARKVPVADVTGAGDTFCSSFITVLDRLGPQKAAEFANAAASICVSSLGARSGAVSCQRVMDLL